MEYNDFYIIFGVVYGNTISEIREERLDLSGQKSL